MDIHVGQQVGINYFAVGYSKRHEMSIIHANVSIIHANVSIKFMSIIERRTYKSEKIGFFKMSRDAKKSVFEDF